jgi:hypothetical protein
VRYSSLNPDLPAIYDADIDAEIVSTRRTSLPPPDRFSGTWLGLFAVRSCSFTGWSGCPAANVGAAYEFRLALEQQAGDAVSGTLNLQGPVLDVAGEVTGNSLSLTGARAAEVSGGIGLTRITQWSVRRDVLGRLSGTFSYAEEFRQNAGALYSAVYDVELVSVIRVP